MNRMEKVWLKAIKKANGSCVMNLNKHNKKFNANHVYV